jgi:hypothetical protein
VVGNVHRVDNNEVALGVLHRERGPDTHVAHFKRQILSVRPWDGAVCDTTWGFEDGELFSCFYTALSHHTV